MEVPGPTRVTLSSCYVSLALAAVPLTSHVASRITDTLTRVVRVAVVTIAIVTWGTQLTVVAGRVVLAVKTDASVGITFS